MKISLEELQMMNACTDAQAWLVRTGYGPGEHAITAAMLNAVPDQGWIIWYALRKSEDLRWKVKRIAFREAARIPALTHLNQWSETLGPGNWRDAHRAARAAYAAATYARATPHATDIERTLANRAADAATYAADTATYNDPDEIYANAIFAAHSSAAYFDYSTVFSAQKHTKAEIVAMCREWLLNN